MFELDQQEEHILGLDQAMELRPRVISGEQMARFEQAIGEIFEAFGMDLHTSSTEETPRRFLQALFEATDGYDGDPKLYKIFDTEYRDKPDSPSGQIIEGPIPFYALCEHHALPFFGNAYIGYIPNEHIIGISKLTRLVRLFARRFAVQERVGEQIASAFETMLAPHGVAVYLEAHHLCVAMRGVRDSNPMTQTTHWRGQYAQDKTLRTEFLLLARSRAERR